MIRILFCFLLSSLLADAPFNYDLHLTRIPGKTLRPMILFHGYGSSYRMIDRVKTLNCLQDTLISFNFPDHDLFTRAIDPGQLTFGTIEEILPAFYVLKKVIIDDKNGIVDLYGFSAGGGALINIIAILNSSRFKPQLQNIGIDDQARKQILNAIQKGVVILDVPLKSIEEIIAHRGSTPELEILAKSFSDNQLIPINNLNNLKGLNLTIFLNFQKSDEVIYNRDDNLFIKRLKNVNPNTTVTIGNEGGHLSFHHSLWSAYFKQIEKCDF